MRIKEPRTAFSVAMMLIAVAGVMSFSSRVPLSDFWNGVVSGVRIGLLVVALVLVSRGTRARRAAR